MDDPKSSETRQSDHDKRPSSGPMGEIRSLERRLIELKREVIRTSSGVLADVAEDDELTLLLVESAGRYYAVPIFVIEEVLQMPALDDIDGLLIGSANAIRHAGEKLEALKELLVLAVGSKTAELARESGFRRK